MTPIRDDSYRDQDIEPIQPHRDRDEIPEELPVGDESKATGEMDAATAAAVQHVKNLLLNTPPFRFRGTRYRSSFTILGIPFLAISKGPDMEKGEIFGHAKGIIAIGDVATGVLAIGGISRGVFALGGLALGGITVGGCSIGLLAAFGGLAVGSIAIGGCAIGGFAIGGCAIGYAAVGGMAIGQHTIGPQNQDPMLVNFFKDLGRMLGIL